MINIRKDRILELNYFERCMNCDYIFTEREVENKEYCPKCEYPIPPPIRTIKEL